MDIVNQLLFFSSFIIMFIIYDGRKYSTGREYYSYFPHDPIIKHILNIGSFIFIVSFFICSVDFFIHNPTFGISMMGIIATYLVSERNK